MSGFIKLRHGLRGHWIEGDGWTLAVFVHLLLRANWADRLRIIDGQKETLKRGEVSTSIRQIADNLKFDRRTVKRRLDILESESVIHRRCAGKFTIISIAKYDSVGDEDEGDVPVDVPRNVPQDVPLQKRTIEIEENKKRSKTTLDPKTSIPQAKIQEYLSDSTLADGDRAWYERQWRKFTGHYEGRREKNWTSRWRNWLDNARYQFNDPPNKSNGAGKPNLSRRERQMANLKKSIMEGIDGKPDGDAENLLPA